MHPTPLPTLLPPEAAYGPYIANKSSCHGPGLGSGAPASDLVRIKSSPGYRDIASKSATELLLVAGHCSSLPLGSRSKAAVLGCACASLEGVM